MEVVEVICGVLCDKVVLYEMVLGGSFGVCESKYWLFEVSYFVKKMGVFVKLMNSCEDEMCVLYGYLVMYYWFEGVFDVQGWIDVLCICVVLFVLFEQWELGYFDWFDCMDYSIIEVIFKWDFLYCVYYMDIGWVWYEMGILMGWYCVVSFIFNVFVIESFMDELVVVVWCDLVEFCVVYMVDWFWYVDVLCIVVYCVGWGKIVYGYVLGVVIYQVYDSYIVVVVQVVCKDGCVVVERFICVVDVGFVVLCIGVEEQFYGGLMWGFGYVLFDCIDIQGGVVQ